MTGRPRILISEGSSLSARETVTALGLAGQRCELVSSDPLCLARFSGFVDRVHAAPACGRDPDGYLAAVLDIVARRDIDVLLPVHEQAYLFAAARRRLPAGLGVALADFAAFEQVQSKAALAELLTRLSIPQPPTEIAERPAALLAVQRYPVFVKAAFGTASSGVWRVDDAGRAHALASELDGRGAFAQRVVIQQAVAGPLERIQAVFDRGRLIASHAYRQVVSGPGGGDVLKQSVHRPQACASVRAIGGALRWHGALSFDYIVDKDSGLPLLFDANPRLVEPMNAWLSGVDLPGALLAVSRDEHPAEQPEGRDGVITRLGLMGLMEAAAVRGRRRDVLADLLGQMLSAGRYRDSAEELLPLRSDPLCAVPLAVVLGRSLLAPASVARLARQAVEAYSLTPAAIERLRLWACESPKPLTPRHRSCSATSSGGGRLAAFRELRSRHGI